MSTTSSHLPVCVYCGTARPADETLCPNCGKPWIDTAIDTTTPSTEPTAAAPPPSAETSDTTSSDMPPATAAASGATAAGASGAAASPPPSPPPPPLSPDDTGEFSFDDWTLPPERPKSRARWLIPILLLIAVVVVWGVVFLDGGSTPTTVAGETTTTEAVTTTTQATTTTEAVTTTTEAVTTTTVPLFPPPSDWIPVGEPIPTEDLALRADGIGELTFGSALAFVAGRLTATFGEAEAAGIDGLCPTGEGYWLQWGNLRAIFEGPEPDSSFVSYRYEDVGSDTDLGLATLSGLEVGDTVADLQTIYATFTITFEVIDGQDYFRLSSGELLLWGPVSSSEPDGIVEGIYSPSSCDS